MPRALSRSLRAALAVVAIAGCAAAQAAQPAVSEKEPELATRLKAVEYATLDIQKQAKVIESFEGFSAGASLTMVGQKRSGIDAGGTQLNYRADILLSLPRAPAIRNISGFPVHREPGRQSGQASGRDRGLANAAELVEDRSL